MDDPATPESVNTTEHIAKQLFVWQFMGVVLTLMAWSFIDLSAMTAAIVGGAVVLLPNWLSYFLMSRAKKPTQVLVYGYLRTIVMMCALLGFGVLFRSQIIPFLVTAGVGILVPVFTTWMLPRTERPAENTSLIRE
ncbi:MAG: hypothetical protein OXC80_00980 [Gammaproteobacteria bacterium]|nr:hypothetical protein [Gammaproteobacteria bacterium]